MSKRLVYSVFDQLLASNIELPELSLHVGQKADLFFRLADHDCVPPAAERLIHQWRDSSGVPVLSSYGEKQGYILQFPDQATFHISIEEQEIVAYTRRNAEAGSIRHQLLDQVIPRMLGHQGRVVVHAAMVVRQNGNAIVFAGDTGWGKSTLAASYLAEGAVWLSDDSLILEVQENELVGISGYPGLRLLDDSRLALLPELDGFSSYAGHTTKQRLEMSSSGCPSRVRVEAVFLLNAPPGGHDKVKVLISSALGPEAMMSLIAQLFVLDPRDHGHASRRFQLLGELLGTDVPVFDLSYPRNHEALPAVRAAVAGCLSKPA